MCVCAKWDCGPQAFLANTVATGDITKAMHRIESCERCWAFPEQVGHEFYHLKVLITLEQMITSVVEKKNNLINMQNFDGPWVRPTDRVFETSLFAN